MTARIVKRKGKSATPYKIITIRVTEELHGRVQASSAQSNTSANQLINELIQSGQRFRVGMWIGKKSSPKLLKGDRKKNDARNILQNMKIGSIQHSSRVIMFESCPWCGDSSVKDPLQWQIGLLNNRDALIGKCAAISCIFSEKEGIPFTCLDEDIYNNPPSVLLGTADKFVQATKVAPIHD